MLSNSLIVCPFSHFYFSSQHSGRAASCHSFPNDRIRTTLKKEHMKPSVCSLLLKDGEEAETSEQVSKEWGGGGVLSPNLLHTGLLPR